MRSPVIQRIDSRPYIIAAMSKPEPLQPDSYYHIYNRGVNRCNLFTQPSDYDLFLKLYIRYIDPIAETFAYCFMRNHFHLFVRIKPSQPDSEFPNLTIPAPSQSFSNLFNAYTKTINQKHHRTGSLFEHPFHRIPVTTDAYFTQLIPYIHFNPQKHGFVKDFRDWPYSSYGAILSERPTRVQRGQVLAWFEDVDRFVDSHTNPLDVDQIPGAGDDEWME